MTENNHKFLDTVAIFWALVFAAVFAVVIEVLKYAIEHLGSFQQEHPVIYEYLQWGIILLPWFVLIFITYLYFKWRNRANKNKWEDIERITGLERYIKKLDGSGHHPRELLDKIERKLDFMGHGASKWTANRNKLARMLETIAYNEGKARFLVINPLQTGLEPGGAKRIALSLRTLWELKKDHTNLEVRVYEHIPQLRLTFYDDDLVVVGHYQGRDRQDSSNTPLLVFKRQCEWSFYKAFLSHFEAEWNRATDLARLDISAIDQLARG